MSELHEIAEKHLVRFGGAFAEAIIERAKGTVLYTTDGREILDFTSGQMSAILGHANPEVLKAIREASETVAHLHSSQRSPAVIRLAEKLAALLPPSLSKAMFLSTGGEANECAIRMAKLYTGGFEIVGFDRAWHGMTGGASSTTYTGATARRWRGRWCCRRRTATARASCATGITTGKRSSTWAST